MSSERFLSIDALKGVGIVLVLMAHAMGGLLSQVAYTFHVPLFFIVCGMFVKPSDSWLRSLTKDAKRLLLPAVFTIVIVFSSRFYWESESHEFDYDLVYRMPGNLWFLFALFWAKQAFTLIVSKLRTLPIQLIVCLCVGGLACVAEKMLSVPFMFAIGLSTLPFLWIGRYACQYCDLNRLPRVFFLSIPLWGIYAFFGKIALNFEWCYVPDILAASGGALMVFKCLQWLEVHARPIISCFAFLGGVSLVLICAPSIETYCFPMHEILPQELPFRSLFVMGSKVVWCALCVLACMKIAPLRRLFRFS